MKQNKTTSIKVRTTEEFKKRVEDSAALENKDMSSFTTDALNEKMDKRKRKEK